MLEFNQPNTTEERVTLFADVILPVPVPKPYTYRIPFEWNDNIAVGQRVIVQFGRKKILTAIVAGIHEQPPHNYEAKYILEVLDDFPVFSELQLKFLYWMADYYMCHPGEVINAALPAGMKVSSESRIQINPHKEIDPADLNELEKLVVDTLITKESLTYDEISEVTGRKSNHLLVKSLIAKEAIILYELVKDRFKPKKVKKIRLNVDLMDDGNLEQLVNSLNGKAKQQGVVLKYLQHCPVHENPELNDQGIDKSLLMQGDVSVSSLSTLTKNGIIEEFEVIVSRFDGKSYSTEPRATLSEIQTGAKEQILEHFKTKNNVLLHGVTGSGKTEVYIDLILDVLEKGGQVLYLVPEIALSTQIVIRLRKIFGDKMGVYHSRYSDNERVETWKGIVEGRFKFVVGVRSSIFLPFANLGLIIVDEEHDTSFKQFEPAPRFQARDSAIMLGKMHEAKVLLGSATPSVETYFHAKAGHFGLVTLSKRHGGSPLPQISLVDNKPVKGEAPKNFNQRLIDDIGNSLERSKQTLIFQNRRGYAPYVQCNQCNHISQCNNCNVSLTYHMFSQELRCHYCGYSQRIPTNCPDCGSQKLELMGHGTEKIEDELSSHFPKALIQRMDFDTTRKKNSYERIIEDFAAGRTDILVGTQMITKGLDFKEVNLVGIFDADRMINYPDFRAQERAFQMMSQVSGRSGRREEQGQVVIQTKNTYQPILQKVVDHDYRGFYEKEIWEREKYNYPPYSRLIKITIKDLDRNKSYMAAEKLVSMLKIKLGNKRVLGPEEPLINKIRNNFLTDIMIKLERQQLNLAKAKRSILDVVTILKAKHEFKTCYVTIDVDPG